MVGNFLTSLVVVTLSKTLHFNEQEHKSYVILRKLLAEDVTESKAANVIRYALKLKQLKEKNQGNISVVHSFIFWSKLKESIKIFRSDYK